MMKNITSQQLDSIIIGPNDIEINAIAKKTKMLSNVSGNYHEIKTNSILVDNSRISYMDFFSRIISEIKGEKQILNCFELPNLSVLCLKSYLTEYNFNVELVNFFNTDKEKLKELLKLNPYSVVITTTYYVDSQPIIDIINFIRKYNKNVKIIIGGPYIFNLYLHYPENLLHQSLKMLNADVYIINTQGEATLVKVLNEIKHKPSGNYEPLNNVIYKNDNTPLKHKKELENINDYEVNWHLFNTNSITPTVLYRTAIGCPYSCSFCNYPIISNHTLMDIRTIEKDFIYFKSIGIKNIIFIDDTFNIPLIRFKEILKMMIKNKFEFKWVSFFRCASADQETFDLLKESGCIAVFLGIESGSQKILNNMNKFAEVEKYKKAIFELNKRNILTYGSFIIGFPGETEETVRVTQQFIEESELTFYNLQLYFQDSITPINQKRSLFNILGQNYNWSHSTMDWKIASDYIIDMYKNINSSIPLTLLGFSIWALPYFISKGYSIDQFINFSKLIKPIFINGLDDKNSDFKTYKQNFIELFS